MSPLAKTSRAGAAWGPASVQVLSAGGGGGGAGGVRTLAPRVSALSTALPVTRSGSWGPDLENESGSRSQLHDCYQQRTTRCVSKRHCDTCYTNVRPSPVVFYQKSKCCDPNSEPPTRREPCRRGNGHLQTAQLTSLHGLLRGRRAAVHVLHAGLRALLRVLLPLLAHKIVLKREREREM